MKSTLKRILQLLLLATQNDIVSVLKREFQKINTLDVENVTALYYTVSAFNPESKSPALDHMILTMKQAMIARMIELVRLEEGKMRENLAFSTEEPQSQTMKIHIRMINGPIEEKIRIMRTKFYESTRDGAFYEV